MNMRQRIADKCRNLNKKKKKLTFYINMYIFFETMSLIFEEQCCISAVF